MLTSVRVVDDARDLDRPAEPDAVLGRVEGLAAVLAAVLASKVSWYIERSQIDGRFVKVYATLAGALRT